MESRSCLTKVMMQGCIKKQAGDAGNQSQFFLELDILIKKRCDTNLK